MSRAPARLMLLTCGLLASGCALPGWYRAVGHFPGIAPSDYAFYTFCGVSSQVFQFSPQQVQQSAVQAMRDFGFRDLGPLQDSPEGCAEMQVRTPDGRLATVSFTPQGEMTNMRFTVGPCHIGDEMLARDLFRRVGVNFGTLPRVYLPVEPVLARRNNPPTTFPPEVHGPDPITLEGEGLRPGEEGHGSGLEFTAPVTGAGSGIVPQPFDPYRTYQQGVGYPGLMYDPFGSSYFQPPIPMLPAVP